MRCQQCGVVLHSDWAAIDWYHPERGAMKLCDECAADLGFCTVCYLWKEPEERGECGECTRCWNEQMNRHFRY